MKEASHKKTNAVCFHLFEVPRGVRFRETENGGCQGWGAEGNELKKIKLVASIKDSEDVTGDSGHLASLQ